MAQGTLTPRPKLAGSYWDWLAYGFTPLPPSIGGVVAVVGTHDSGPANEAILLRDTDELREIFGTTVDDFYRQIVGAFKGEGFNGKGGATAVVAFRQATGAVAKATVTLDNTAAADAITLTAKYPGTRGNALRIAVIAGAGLGEKELQVLDGAQVVERYPHVETDIAALVSDINIYSTRLDAVMVADGVALADQAATNIAGGNDGAVITGTEWTVTFNKLDLERWSIVTPANLTDATLRASVVAWVKSRNILGRRSLLVLGGAIDETIATANSRSQAINNWDVVNLGVGRLRLNDHGNAEVSTAQFTGRVAGAIAFRGEKKDLIYTRFADVEVVTGPSLSDTELAFDRGVVVFSRDTDLNAPVHIRDGVTTYSNDSQSPVDEDGFKTRPVEWYRRVKNIRIQHAIELEVDEWATSGDVLGDLPVNERMQGIVKGRFEEAYGAREKAEIVQPGWSVDVLPTQSQTDDYVRIKHGFYPTRSLRQMFNEAKIG